MAANLKDEEEKDRRIIFVGEFAKETGYSTRKLSSILSSSYFKISNATVSDYLHRYMNMKRTDADAIRKTIEENKDVGIENERVRQRVIKSCNLIMEGYKIEEISELLGESYWTIYRDITSRLKQLDEDKYIEVKEELSKRSMENIEQRHKH